MASLCPLALLLTQITTAAGFFGPPGFADPGMFMGPYGYDPYGGYYAYDPYGGYPYPPFYYFPPGYPGGQNVQQGTGQGAQGPPGCSSHEECGGPNLCISGQCQPMEPTTTKCQSDSDCPQGGCKVGYCWQAPGTGGPMQPVQPGGGQGIANQTTGTGVGTPCAQQNDCAGDQMCGPDGKCVKGFSIEINCNSDSDCDKKNRCKGGTCWTQGDTRCLNNMDCMPNMVCRYGFCDIDPKLIMESMEGCSSHDDCPGAQICLQSNCKSASSKGAACWSDAQCAQGNEGCKFGFCWIARVSDEVVEVKESTSKPDISATCLDHAECSEAAICYEQQCRNAKPSEQPCITDTDCRPLQACKYEYCWSINDQGQLNENVKQPQCNRHEQCSLTKVCSSKDLVCVPAYPVGKVCSNAYDCDAFEECKEGICWRKGVETGKEENEECQFHSDCNGYTICFNYVCIPAMPTEIRCEDDTLCPHMASGCKYERCWIAIDEQETDSSMNEPVR
ncbi:hypothetical protein D918_08416 [Trichuris suis]|nr:hypothetical protein D918_08416 [Trichuris suis]